MYDNLFANLFSKTNALAILLEGIPDSISAGSTLPELAKLLNPNNPNDPIVVGYISGVIELLGLIGAIKITYDDQGLRIKAESEIAFYLLHSFAEHWKEDLTILYGWQGEGFINPPNSNNVIRAVDFLATIESRRLQEIENPKPIRSQLVSQIIIKRKSFRNSYGQYLVQFDNRAQQYQLIGGRFRESDVNSYGTAVREFIEELGVNPFDSSECDLIPLIEGIVAKVQSATFGAYSHYNFSFFHLRNSNPIITENPINRWVTFDEFSQGRTLDGFKIASSVAMKLPVDWLELSSSFK